MPTSYLSYPLTGGYLHHWLVAGPVMLAASTDLLAAGQPRQELAWLRHQYEPDSGVTEAPVERGSLGELAGSPSWRYYRCRDDHFVDFTAEQPTAGYRQAWAFATVTLASAQPVHLALTTHGPVDVWLNNQHRLRQEHLDRRRPRRVRVPVTLQPGSNDLLVRWEMLGAGPAGYVMALQIQGLADEAAQVDLPTALPPEAIEKRQALERIVEAATLDRYVYGYWDGDHHARNEPVVIRFPDDLDAAGDIMLRLQSLAGDIYQERTVHCGAGTLVEMAKAFPLNSGPHHLALLPPAKAYYEEQIRFERKELFYVRRTAYHLEPGASDPPDTRAALEVAAQRSTGSLFCEIAKMGLDRWKTVNFNVMNSALERINQGHDGSGLELLGLLGSRLRFRTRKHYFESLRHGLEAAILAYRYGEPTAVDGEPTEAMVPVPESRQIVLYACEILAGQWLPQRTFSRSGRTGRWHRERGEALAIGWLRQRALYGFREWHSPGTTEAIVAALAWLVDLANSPEVATLSAALLDKIFFGLAVNSFQGAYGTSRGRTDTASALSARLEPTSGLAWLLWGAGNPNEHLLGMVSLAVCRNYTLPDVIRRIAQDSVAALWSRERQVLPGGERRPQPKAAGEETGVQAWDWDVNTVTYRTKDFMLACAQDYAPGQPGRQEHIWQATLGPDAVVFVNHPTSFDLDDAHQPNLWAGNGVLPRAAQWGDVLLCLYHLPADDWLGFTHAYFPVAAFDENAIAGRWAFARRGQGYLALWAARGFSLVTTGATAYRELRSPGHENIWVCHMGQALLDGSFSDFQEKIGRVTITFDGLAVRFESLRRDRLAFGWQGPLLVNDEPQSLANSRHIENPYCVADLPATQLQIAHGHEGIQLEFG